MNWLLLVYISFIPVSFFGVYCCKENGNLNWKQFVFGPCVVAPLIMFAIVELIYPPIFKYAEKYADLWQWINK